MHGNTLHAEAVKFYRDRNMLSQKDLLARMGFTSVRSVQRLRLKYGLKPKSYWGCNPLFAIAEIERVEKLIAKERAARMSSKMQAARACRLITLKQARRRAGKRARK